MEKNNGNTKKQESLFSIVEQCIKTDRICDKRLSRTGKDEEARPSRNSIYYIKGQNKSYVIKQGPLEEMTNEATYIHFTQKMVAYAHSKMHNIHIAEITGLLIREEIEKQPNMSDILIKTLFGDSGAILILEQGGYDSFETLYLLRDGKNSPKREIYEILETKLIERILENSAKILGLSPIYLAEVMNRKFKAKHPEFSLANGNFERYFEKSYKNRMQTRILSLYSFLMNPKVSLEMTCEVRGKRRQKDKASKFHTNFSKVMDNTQFIRNYLASLKTQYYADSWWGNNLDELTENENIIQLDTLVDDPMAKERLLNVNWKVTSIDFGSVTLLPLAIDYATIAVVGGYITPDNEDNAMKIFFSSYNEGVKLFNEKVKEYKKDQIGIIISEFENCLETITSDSEFALLSNLITFIKGERVKKAPNPLLPIEVQIKQQNYNENTRIIVNNLLFYFMNMSEEKELMYDQNVLNDYENKLKEFKISCYAAMFSRGILFASAQADYIIKKGTKIGQRTIEEINLCLNASYYGLDKFIECVDLNPQITDTLGIAKDDALSELELARTNMKKIIEIGGPRK